MSKMTNREFFQNILDKVAYAPPAQGMPMDPAMMGGAPPPQGMPMDPAMMGGAPPPQGMPMDPAMMGGAPPQPGAPGGDPVEMLLQVLMGIDEKLDALLAQGGGGGEGEKEPTSAEIVDEGLSDAASEEAGLASMARGAAPAAGAPPAGM